MTNSELTKEMQQSLHSIRSYLSPVTTYFGLVKHQGISQSDRDKLLQKAEENLKLVINELENMSVFFKNKEDHQTI